MTAEKHSEVCWAAFCARHPCLPNGIPSFGLTLNKSVDVSQSMVQDSHRLLAARASRAQALQTLGTVSRLQVPVVSPPRQKGRSLRKLAARPSARKQNVCQALTLYQKAGAKGSGAVSQSAGGSETGFQKDLLAACCSPLSSSRSELLVSPCKCQQVQQTAGAFSRP